MRIFLAHNSCWDDVRESWDATKQHERNECHNSIFSGHIFIFNDQAQLFKHHNVDKSLLIGRVEVSNLVRVLQIETLGKVDVNDLFFLIVQEIINFIKLPLLLRFDIFDLGKSWKVVTEAHTDSITNYSTDAEGEDAIGWLVGWDTTEDDEEGIDAAIEATVDEGLQVLSCVDMAFRVVAFSFVGKQGLGTNLSFGHNIIDTQI